MEREERTMNKTNFDKYLEEHLADPDFAEKFEHAGKAWDVAIQLAELRRKAGLSQTELARRLKTSQQQISRLESPSYEGHSLAMLRRVAETLDAKLSIRFEPTSRKTKAQAGVHESKAPYGKRKSRTKAKPKITP